MGRERKSGSGNGRRKGPWAHGEIERLKRLYGLRPDQQIARELSRSVESVRRMARRVFAGPPRTGPWSAEEVQQLKDYIGASPPETIAMILRRTVSEVEHKIEELRRNRHSGPWSSADLHTLKRLYGTRTNEDLAVILGRTVSEIEEAARSLALAKDKGFRRRRGDGKPVRMPRWTAEEVELLRDLYPDTPNLEIARRLGRTVKAVVSKANDLGLKKSEKRLRQMGKENVRIRYGQARPDEVLHRNLRPAGRPSGEAPAEGAAAPPGGEDPPPEAEAGRGNEEDWGGRQSA